MNLSQLPIGSRGQVVQVEGVDEISVRLMEMGLVPGTEFTIRIPFVSFSPATMFRQGLVIQKCLQHHQD